MRNPLGRPASYPLTFSAHIGIIPVAHHTYFMQEDVNDVVEHQ